MKVEKDSRLFPFPNFRALRKNKSCLKAIRFFSTHFLNSTFFPSWRLIEPVRKHQDTSMCLLWSNLLLHCEKEEKLYNQVILIEGLLPYNVAQLLLKLWCIFIQRLMMPTKVQQHKYCSIIIGGNSNTRPFLISLQRLISHLQSNQW